MNDLQKWFAFAALIASAVSGCTRTQDAPRENSKMPQVEVKQSAKARYVHTVIWYFRDDAPKDEADTLIADAHRLLAKIPSVRGLWIGRPADQATPKLAQTDYQVGMMLLFDDYAGLKDYLDHELHLEFRAKHAHHAQRVPVFDFVDRGN
jgi:Stress responsive A/B Barrel Domain